jgi:hypothetical protein
MLSLYAAMDKMKSRYGFDAVMRCAGATLSQYEGCYFETEFSLSYVIAIYLKLYTDFTDFY